jgi:hypothetical protein
MAEVVDVDVRVSRAELARAQRELFAARTAVVAAAAAIPEWHY